MLRSAELDCIQATTTTVERQTSIGWAFLCMATRQITHDSFTI